mmetsp:Transcript_54349/g.116744  ORF Transcript_54349/g.116744 Transcript_54349/m.116744 type:complete len:375 (-) Transcript_54349:552-1676(-)
MQVDVQACHVAAVGVSQTFLLEVPTGTSLVDAYSTASRYGQVRSCDSSFLASSGVVMVAYFSAPSAPEGVLRPAPSSMQELSLKGTQEEGAGSASASTTGSPRGSVGSVRDCESEVVSVAAASPPLMPACDELVAEGTVPDPMAEDSRAGRRGKGRGSKVSFVVDLGMIAKRRDLRTTVMVKNIPNRMTKERLYEIFAPHIDGRHDCFYLPVDPFRRCNIGFGFINFHDAADIIPFYNALHGMQWSTLAEHKSSTKVCEITYSRAQGKHKLLKIWDRSGSSTAAEAPEEQHQVYPVAPMQQQQGWCEMPYEQMNACMMGHDMYQQQAMCMYQYPVMMMPQMAAPVGGFPGPMGHGMDMHCGAVQFVPQETQYTD